MSVSIFNKSKHKKIILLIVVIFIIKATYARNQDNAKQYAVLSFFKNQLLHQLLFNAAMTGNELLIIDAVKRNAQLNIQDRKGYTPLIVAVLNGYYHVVEALLMAGAMLSIKDNSGRTALDYALQSNNKKVAALLLEAAKNY
ncbi:ankyrin repeat domain-containing protein [Candidatus Dependentiae bacterium]|nr:MAG: ankyrin repeat domain-containing protein [Candidatus Dependentiae bacterium]